MASAQGAGDGTDGRCRCWGLVQVVGAGWCRWWVRVVLTGDDGGCKCQANK